MTTTKTHDEHSLSSHIKESEFSTVLSSIGDGVIVTDQQLRIVAFNSTAEDLLGKKESEVLGESVEALFFFHNEQRSEQPFDFNGVIERKEEVAQAEHMFMLQLGELTIAEAEKQAAEVAEADPADRTVGADLIWIPITLLGAPIVEEGTLRGAVFTVRDVSREYEINRMKSEFVSIVSHQLRTPLSAIKWFLETLIENKQGDPVSERQQDYMEQAFQSNERMISLINDLLNVSRLEAGKIRNERETVEIAAIVASVVKEIDTFAHANNVTIDCSFCDGPLPEVLVDPGKVRQVIQNLISNGVKYSKGKSTLKIDATVEKTHIVFSIADQGIGISPEDQERLFEPFFRAGNAIATQAEGSGLGLYICKMLLEMNEGEIWVESVVGEGTTFYFSLPLDKQNK